VIAADLVERGAASQLVADAGDVDILVANAALPASGPLLDYTAEQIDRALEVNLRAPIMLARELAPAMVERKRGHIVFISSLSGKTGQAGSSLYSATKFGVRGFAQGLRGDLAPAGVGVSTVFPGFIRDAGMFHKSAADLPRGVGTSTPQQVADAVISAIVKNRSEKTVAPLSMKVGAAIGGIAPDLALRVAKMSGGDRVSEQVARGQQHLR
jgi:short-subunit dehydrogenase